jgi:hypothetical protein
VIENGTVEEKIRVKMAAAKARFVWNAVSIVAIADNPLEMWMSDLL